MLNRVYKRPQGNDCYSEHSNIAELVWSESDSSMTCMNKSGLTTKKIAALSSLMINIQQNGEEKYIKAESKIWECGESLESYEGREGWAGDSEIEDCFPQNRNTSCILRRSSLYRFETKLGGSAGYAALHVLQNAPIGVIVWIITNEIPATDLHKHANHLGSIVMACLNRHNSASKEHCINVLQINSWCSFDRQAKVQFLDGMASEYHEKLSIKIVEAVESPFDAREYQ